MEYVDYEYPEEHEMETLEYPTNFKSFKLCGYTFMYPLSSSTFLTTTTDYKFYFGRLSPTFEPFSPLHTAGLSIKFYSGPKFDYGPLSDLKLSYSNISKKAYIFFRAKKIGHVIYAMSAEFPRPHLRTRIYIVFKDPKFIDFEVDSSQDPDSEFSLISFSTPDQCLYFMQLNLMEGLIIRKKKLVIEDFYWAEMISV